MLGSIFDFLSSLKGAVSVRQIRLLEIWTIASSRNSSSCPCRKVSGQFFSTCPMIFGRRRFIAIFVGQRKNEQSDRKLSQRQISWRKGVRMSPGLGQSQAGLNKQGLACHFPKPKARTARLITTVLVHFNSDASGSSSTRPSVKS